MKHFRTITIIAAIMAAIPASAQPFRQSNELEITMLGMASSADRMPFWAFTNKHGLMPSGRSGALVYAGWKDNLMCVSRGETPVVSMSYGISAAAYATDAMPSDAGNWYGASKSSKAMIDEAYLSAGWRKWSLDLGMRDKKPSGTVWADPFGGLSLTGGDLINSGNARNFLGYTLRTEPIRLVGGLYAYGRWGDYKPLDRRYDSGELLHMKDLYLMYRIGERWELTVGLEHACQWGGQPQPKRVDGVLVEQNPAPKNLDTYLRVIMCRQGGSSSTVSDQINAEGNHLGRELMKLRYRGDGWTLIAQHDIPFEDGSGMQFLNFPDGVNTLAVSFDDKDLPVHSLVLEYVYTKCQSGWPNAKWREATQAEIDKGLDSAERPGYIHDGYGGDNYFNHGGFRSGWQYYGYTAGLPLIIPDFPDSEGLVPGVRNNRLTGFHIGMGGRLFHRVDYSLLVTSTRNSGRFTTKKLDDGTVAYITSIDPAQNQHSVALETLSPLSGRLSVTANFYADRGSLLPISYGALLGLRFRL